MRVLFAGGVTGGHIAPGLALAEKITADVPGSEVLFASVANETEARMIARSGFRLVKVTARTSGAAAAALQMPLAWMKSLRLLASFRPDVVVGLGGASSLGGALAAITARRPLVLLEGNVIPGRTTRRLAPWAAGICCQSEAAAGAIGRASAAFTGSPVRKKIIGARVFAKAAVRQEIFGLDPRRLTVLVVGGSQGAAPINRVMMDAAPKLDAAQVQVVHVAGEDGSPAAANAYRAAGVTAHVLGFFEKMHLAYAAADVAVSRAGAASLAEFAAVGLPAILVPLPHARDDHQRANARLAVEQGWAVMVEQADLDGEAAAALIGKLLAERPHLNKMRANALAAARCDAADVILERLRSLVPRAQRGAEPDAGQRSAAGM